MTQHEHRADVVAGNPQSPIAVHRRCPPAVFIPARPPLSPDRSIDELEQLNT